MAREPGGRFRLSLSLLAAAGLCACEAEKRPLGPSPPSSPPISASDARTSQYQDSAFQVAQGGRLFGWYGCQSCHGETAKGAANLYDDSWENGGSVDQVYASIAKGRPDGMPAYEARVASEQIWQLTAFVRDLHKIPLPKLHRQTLDQAGEPQGTQWSGAVR